MLYLTLRCLCTFFLFFFFLPNCSHFLLFTVQGISHFLTRNNAEALQSYKTISPPMKCMRSIMHPHTLSLKVSYKPTSDYIWDLYRRFHLWIAPKLHFLNILKTGKPQSLLQSHFWWKKARKGANKEKQGKVGQMHVQNYTIDVHHDHVQWRSTGDIWAAHSKSSHKSLTGLTPPRV